MSESIGQGSWARRHSATRKTQGVLPWSNVLLRFTATTLQHPSSSRNFGHWPQMLNIAHPTKALFIDGHRCGGGPRKSSPLAQFSSSLNNCKWTQKTTTMLCAGGLDYSTTTASITGAFTDPLRLASSIRMTTDITSPSSSSAAVFFLSSSSQPQQFEPVLNVPAFSVFCLVALLCVSLQWRVAAIGRATTERTRALEQLRQVKTQQLVNNNNSINNSTATTTTTTTTNSAEAVQQALDAYEQAYWKVERLRTIIPGWARLVPPPSSLSGNLVQENEAAAQQFLGIRPDTQEAGSSVGAADDDKERQLSPALIAILAVVALSQIALLVLFVATDPMLMGMGGGGVGDTSSGLLMERVVDAVSGLE